MAFLRAMAKLENGSIFVLAGYKSCLMYDMENKKWNFFLEMKHRRHCIPACGVIKNQDGKEEIVIAGGIGSIMDNSDTVEYITVEIYSIEESRWRSGMT
jgi:hypothetical protein